MLSSKKITLKPLLESWSGIHLTAYIVNRDDIIDLKRQIKRVINDSHKSLINVMSVEDRKRFLEPLESLLHETRALKQIKGNIGIFRTRSSFRLLGIPIDIEQACHIATSFHVKPLLKWLQVDREFLFLGLENGSAHIYHGSRDSFKLIDSILFPDFFGNKESEKDYVDFKELARRKFKEQESFACLNEWVLYLTGNTNPKLFIAGESALISRLTKYITYKNFERLPIANHFSRSMSASVCRSIRKILQDETEKSLENHLAEFSLAERSNRVQSDIFQISKDIVVGKVRKLLVSDQLKIFGKINHNTGEVTIHHHDLDHEDDDILDDLAQLVLIRGGEVIVGKKEQMQKDKPILAICDTPNMVQEYTDEGSPKIIGDTKR